MLPRLLVPVLLVSAAAVAAPAIGKMQPTPSDQCGSCHIDIFRMWRQSAHSRSLEDTVFLQAYRETESRDGAAVSRLCLKCHAPMVDVSGDLELREKLTWEGVSCDFCHSLTAVDLSGLGPRQVLDVGRVKRGPIRDASSSAHEVAYSELHTTSLVCAGCHEYVNPEGTAIMTTFSEWKESAAARQGRSCQSCHMGRTRANVVDPRVKRTAHAEVNLHEVPGGHSLDQLHRSLAVTIEPDRKGDRLVAAVRLTNKGAGHAVPTGMPGRRVILEVGVRTSEGRSFEEKRVYGKNFADSHGDPITRDSAHFARGVRAHSDTRIRPDESRTETFEFPVPASAAAYLAVKLHYEHAPTGGAENRTFLTFLSEERTLPPRAERP